MLWAAALTLPMAYAAPVLAQPAAGPPGTASTPAEKIAPQTPSASPANSAMAPAGSMAAVPADLSKADKSFMMKAAEGGMMEVQAGQIATQKGDDTVKAFGQKMITDHTANNKQLAALAEQKGVTVPTELPAKDQAMLTKMKGLSGEKFDTAYLKSQVSGHEKMLKLMETEEKTTKDPDLKSFATSTKAVVQEHLDMAKQDSSASM